ncbi:MAG: hypothetical protein WBD20_27035 [Pirellulaceae bacterium]
MTTLSRGPVSPTVLRWGTVVYAVLASCGLIGVLWQNGSSVARIGCAVIFAISIAWLAYRVGLRLMRYRAPGLGALSALEWMAIAIAIPSPFLLMMLISPAIVKVSSVLWALGPIGYGCSKLAASSEDGFAGLAIVFLLSVVAITVGWWVSRDANTWTNRRRLIESQRLLKASHRKSSANSVALTGQEIERQIRLQLNDLMIGRRYRSWRFWLLPIWLRRRCGWCVSMGVTLMIFVLIVSGLLMYVDTLESTAVIGKTSSDPARRSPSQTLAIMSVVPFALAFVGLESLALLDRIQAKKHPFQQRPQLPWQHLIELHREGLERTPVQCLLAASFAVPIWFGDVLAGGVLFLLISSLTAVLVLRTLLASYEVLQSILPIVHRWFGIAMTSGVMLFAYTIPLAITMLTTPAMLIQLDTSLYATACLAANVLALVLFLILAGQRHLHSTAGERS